MKVTDLWGAGPAQTNKPCEVVGGYAPQHDEKEKVIKFYRDMLGGITRAEVGTCFLIGGDMNARLREAGDKKEYPYQVELWNQFMRKGQLTRLQLRKPGESPWNYSKRSNKGKPPSVSVGNHIAVSSAFKSKVLARASPPPPDIRTDHFSLLAELEWGRGVKCWTSSDLGFPKKIENSWGKLEKEDPKWAQYTKETEEEMPTLLRKMAVITDSSDIERATIDPLYRDFIRVLWEARGRIDSKSRGTSGNAGFDKATSSRARLTIGEESSKKAGKLMETLSRSARENRKTFWRAIRKWRGSERNVIPLRVLDEDPNYQLRHESGWAFTWKDLTRNFESAFTGSEGKVETRTG